MARVTYGDMPAGVKLAAKNFGKACYSSINATVGTLPMKTSLTISNIFEAIEKTEYVVLAGTTTTICVLTLVNGHVVTGTSACVDSKKFNHVEGEKYAFEKACDEVRKLEGYLLRQRVYEAGRNHG